MHARPAPRRRRPVTLIVPQMAEVGSCRWPAPVTPDLLRFFARQLAGAQGAADPRGPRASSERRAAGPTPTAAADPPAR